MKLLFIAPSAYLLGGVQDWLYMTVTGLRLRGHKVMVGMPDNHFHNIKRYNSYYDEIHGIPFRNLSGTSEGRIRALSKFIQLNKADVIVGVNIGDLYEAFKRVAHKLSNTKLVLTLHAIEANYFLDLKEYLTEIDAVITTNRLTERLVQNMIPEYIGRIFYAPYGIICPNTNLPDRNIQNSSLRIAWVGRVENSQKRVCDLPDILIELDRLNIDYKLSIAGDGPCLTRLKETLGGWEKQGKVVFWGFIKRESMQVFYRHNDILLITSEWETGPIVAWEAMEAGLAVVSSKYTGYLSEQSLINNKTALLFEIGNYLEAAMQIARLSDRFLHEEIAVQGRMMVLSKYSESRSVIAWEEAFEKTMKLETKTRIPPQVKSPRKPAGKLDKVFGVSLSERPRHLSPIRRYVLDAGGEWPHSIQGQTNQTF